MTKSAAEGGQFVADGTGRPVDFTLTDKAQVKYLNADASLSDIPTGMLCRFHLYQDARGEFTKAGLVSDEFSRCSGNADTARITGLLLNAGRIEVAWQLPEVKDYNGDMQRPPDIGRCVLYVNAETRIWRGDAAIKLTDLAVG